MWKHEERDFSAWLAENIDVLSDAIGIRLSPPDKERAAGSFSVDLLSEDPDGELVVIENQLECSDHDHLGKVLTYAAAFGAKTAIWIVAEVRSEHAQAIAWLNQMESTSFYLLQAEAIRIGDSAPALNLVRIIGPTQEGKSVGRDKRAIAAEHQERKVFWTALLKAAQSRLGLHRNVSASDDNWCSAATGHGEMSWCYWIRKASWKVDLEIYSESVDWNKAAFAALWTHRDEIEKRFDGSLQWNELPNKRKSSIAFESETGGYRSPSDEWERIQGEMIDAMLRLERAFRPHLAAARSAADAALAARKIEESQNSDLTHQLDCEPNHAN